MIKEALLKKGLLILYCGSNLFYGIKWPNLNIISLIKLIFIIIFLDIPFNNIIYFLIYLDN